MCFHIFWTSEYGIYIYKKIPPSTFDVTLVTFLTGVCCNFLQTTEHTLNGLGKCSGVGVFMAKMAKSMTKVLVFQVFRTENTAY